MNLTEIKDPTLIARLNHLILPSIQDPVQICFYWLKYYDSTELAVNTKKAFHFHRFYEIHFVLCGSEEYFLVDSDRVRVDAMNYLIIPPSIAHQELSRAGHFCKFTVGFDLQQTSADVEKRLEAPVKRFYEKAARIGEVDERMVSCFQNILRECSQWEFCTPYFVRNELFRLLCSVFRSVPNMEKPLQISDERIRSAKEFIAKNLGLPISESEIAQNIGVSIRQLSRLFRKYENCTPLQYVHQWKCSEASRLLRDTSMSLQEISDQLGFGSECYFNIFYKRMMGTTPGNYREKIAKS